MIKARTTLAAAAFAIASFSVANATTIQRVVSPGGIEAWLVQDATVPLIAMDFAFAGGTAQDPKAKPGVANLTTRLLDEGAGELDDQAFRARLEQRAIELDFSAARDTTRGSLRTLKENRDEAFSLLKLAVTAPRFDVEPLERIRTQVLSSLRRETTSPNSISNRRWWETSFPDHPYAMQGSGTLESVPTITPDDLRGHVKRVLARDRLKIAVVGDIDAATLGRTLDDVFGSLPAKGDLVPVPHARPAGLGKRVDVPLDVPQTVITFGGPGIPRSDPDFMTAFVLNFIVGGSTFSSRLYKEVREKRGLAYSVSTSLTWLEATELFVGGTATRSDRSEEAIATILDELKKFAAEGPTQLEVDEAKSYLKGSQMLALDTSSKIASLLVQYQLDNLGIDYIERRNAMIDAVTLADAKRVAKRLLSDGMLFTVVGRATPPKAN
jgi:zinc protease